mmetsp:Transcript_21181/g.30275  ORF Transcript_21181/g.30275 Transcript_21181/m.30275 type:complete len:263 (+) Transcript_21181:186-974(+)
MRFLTQLFLRKAAAVADNERIKTNVLPKTFLRGLGAILLLHAFLGVVVFIGAEFERRKVMAASPTDWLYSTPKVCGVSSSAAANTGGNIAAVGNASFTTFHSETHAKESDSLVAHCGECGKCSSFHDIEVIKSTTQTLTKDSTSCATVGLLTGLNRNLIAKCMESRVGFTNSCQDCWVENIVCSLSKCKFSCMKSVFILNESVNINGRKLNPCLECDEKLCGPRFLECAGANRRRIGVHSDIVREGTEVCAKVNTEWMSATQ